MPIFRLDKDHIIFPHPSLSRTDGILAVGGDLSPERLILAYQNGIFPWYDEGEPILWWSPDPRFVLFPSDLKVSKSMRPYFNQGKFQVTYDQAFKTVMENCAEVLRHGQRGTWITTDMIEAYCRLHELGIAHSVEVWDQNDLVGGLYGVNLGRVFFGESMFMKKSNASKFGFISLVKQLVRFNFELIDCQQQTRHLASLGATSITRDHFLEILDRQSSEDTLRGDWNKIFENNNFLPFQ